MRELPDHRGLVLGLAYSPDGRSLATACSDGEVRLWDAATARCYGRFRSAELHAYCVHFNPDGRTLAAGFGRDNGLVVLWDLELNQHRDCWKAHPRGVRSLAWSPDGRQLLTAGGEDRVKLWDLDRPGEYLEFRAPDAVTTAVLSADGKTVAAVTTGWTATRVWAAGYGRIVAEMKRPPDVEAGARGLAIAYRPGGRTLALTAGRRAALWEPVGRNRPTWTSSADGTVSALAFRPDGAVLAGVADDGVVRLWNPDDGRERQRWDWGIGELASVAFAPDGLTMAAGGYGSAMIWDAD